MKYKYLFAPLLAGFVAIAFGQSVYAQPSAPTASSALIASLSPVDSHQASNPFTQTGAVNCAILPQALCDAADQSPGSDVKQTGIFLSLIHI